MGLKGIQHEIFELVDFRFVMESPTSNSNNSANSWKKIQSNPLPLVYQQPLWQQQFMTINQNSKILCNSPFELEKDDSARGKNKFWILWREGERGVPPVQ